MRDSLRGSHRLSTSIVRCENGAVSIAYIVLSIGENGRVDKGPIKQRGNIGEVSELGQVQKATLM